MFLTIFLVAVVLIKKLYDNMKFYLYFPMYYANRPNENSVYIIIM